MAVTPAGGLLYTVANDTKSNLLNTIGSGAGSCVVTPPGDGAKFVAPCIVRLNDLELASVTGVSGDTLTFGTRGLGGTTAVAHTAGVLIEHIDAAEVIEALRQYAKHSPIVTLSVDQAATGGSGTLGDKWTGWEAAFNAQGPGSHIHFPAGYYTLATALTPNGATLISGAGKYASRIIATANTFDAITLNKGHTGATFPPITGAGMSQGQGWIRIQDLYLGNDTGINALIGGDATGGGITKAGIVINTLTEIEVVACAIQGWKYNLILDQCEEVRIRDCHIGVPVAAGVWIVNNGEHRAGALATQTNDITIDGCQFNGKFNIIHIMDDGGDTHKVSNCNFNAGGRAATLCNQVSTLWDNCRFEGQSFDAIYITELSANSAALVGSSYLLNFHNCTWSQSIAGVLNSIHVVPYTSGVGKQVFHLNVDGCHFSIGAPATPVAHISDAANCVAVNVRGNYNAQSGTVPLVNGLPQIGQFQLYSAGGTQQGSGLGIGAYDFGRGQNCLALGAAGTAPSANPTGAIVLWWDGANLKYLKPSGATGNVV